MLGVSQTPSSTDTPVANWNQDALQQQLRHHAGRGVQHRRRRTPAADPGHADGRLRHPLHGPGRQRLHRRQHGHRHQPRQPERPPPAPRSTALQIHATDSASGQTLTYSATGLPPGLSISSSGLISGTPSSGGTFTSVGDRHRHHRRGRVRQLHLDRQRRLDRHQRARCMRWVPGKCLDDPNSTTDLRHPAADLRLQRPGQPGLDAQLQRRADASPSAAPPCAWTPTARAPPTAPRRSSIPATASPTSSGPSTPTAPSPESNQASAWTSPAPPPPTAPWSNSGPATAAATSNGPSDSTRRTTSISS